MRRHYTTYNESWIFLTKTRTAALSLGASFAGSRA